MIDWSTDWLITRVRRDDNEGEEPPDASDDSGGDGSGVDVTALLHESPDGEPKRVGNRELVLHHVRLGVARVGVVPLVRRKTGKGELEEKRRENDG